MQAPRADLLYRNATSQNFAQAKVNIAQWISISWMAPLAVKIKPIVTKDPAAATRINVDFCGVLLAKVPTPSATTKTRMAIKRATAAISKPTTPLQNALTKTRTVGCCIAHI